MRENVRKSWRQLLIFAGLVLFGTATSAAPMSIRTLGAEQLRLATVGYRVGAANARTCAKPDMTAGLVLHDLTEYAPNARASVSTAFSLHEGVGILEVVPQSVAAAAGLHVDDEVLAVNGVTVPGATSIATSPQSYQRVAQFSEMLSGALTLGPADLLVRRQGGVFHTELTGKPICGGETIVVNSSDINAWSDGRHVFVSTGMMRLAQTEDQLAFVVGHEMAHNILGHASVNDTHGLLSLFGIGSAKIRRQESAADALSVRLMGPAAYEPAAAVEVLRRAQSALWWAVSLDHPSFGERVRAVIGIIAQEAAGPKPLS